MAVAHGTSEGCSPTILGYQMQKLLGVGGMGKVYLARQEALKRLVCVKVLSIPEGEDAEVCRARFNREAELLASVSHPHIVSIFDFGTTADAGLPFLVTEYLEGGDLRPRMKAGKPMPAEKARDILLQVGEAIQFLHEKGIIHRDLKPENILLPTESLCKVCDFGLAVMQGKSGSLTRSGHGLGTLGYVSPEQHYGLRVDERTDQYSLAALGYELLTGRRPLGRFHPPSRWNTGLSRELDKVILKGLAEQPSDRYSSVRDFLRELGPSLGTWRISGPGVRVRVLGLLVTLGITAVAVAAMVMGSGREDASRKGIKTSSDGTLSGTREPSPTTRESAGKGPEMDKSRRSPEFTQLTKLHAYRRWVEEGSPVGKAGEAVREKNWIEAEKQVESDVNARAYALWEEQGRPGGPEGEAASEKNRRAAEIQLLKETEEEMRSHPLR
jgi:serine/threonine protein kinase